MVGAHLAVAGDGRLVDRGNGSGQGSVPGMGRAGVRPAAGARDRTMALASSTATDRPTPNCLMVGSPLRMKLPNTEIMMIAAAAIN